MLTPQFILPLRSELIVDLFAGGGGASTGIEQATGRHVDIAINHDPDAIDLHSANHPQTKHFCSDVFEVDPVSATNGQPVGLLWASPDCKHFSKAKGGKPVSKRIRSLAWVVVKWAKLVRPRIICLENVEEFQTWGPLVNDKPDPARKGMTFRRWIGCLKNLGYAVDWREMRACDYGAPTIRKRLFLIARCDGIPIVWPSPTHGDPKKTETKVKKLKLWRTAAECIDWSLPCPSIFGRKKSLKDATLRRIAHGVMRYVVNSDNPYIVECNHTASWYEGDKSSMVSAFIAKHYGGVVGHDVRQPLGTITTSDHHSMVVTHFVTLRGTSVAHDAAQPLRTVTAGGRHAALVAALLVKYYGNDKTGVDIRCPMHTIPTKDRFGLVTTTIHGETYAITDIGMRMLQPHELFKAQGFPPNYIFDRINDRPVSKTVQTRLCGNSVCPPIASAIIRANFVDQENIEVAA